MEKKQNLNKFLITRFLFALAFILITEALINLFFINVAFPFFNQTFHADIFLSRSPSGSLFALIRGLGWLILSGLTNSLPYSFSVPFRALAQQLAEKDISSLFDRRAIWSNIFIVLALLLLLFLVILIYLLPYIVATVFYSRMIITEVREIREADAAKQEEFNRRRNLLLSDIAHDLKTPITTISGYAQALNTGMIEEPKKQAEYLSAISSKSIQLSNLITLLFEYVTLDSDGFKLKREEANITELVLELLASQYSDFEDAGMELDILIPDEPIYANVDSVQLSRAVTNLLVNVMRHNASETKVRSSMTKDRDWIRIQIADSGLPIDDSIRPTLFEPFVLGDQSRSRKGSGLGLSISSRIIELHGGSLTLEQPVDSPYNKAFCIKLPCPADKFDY